MVYDDTQQRLPLLRSIDDVEDASELPGIYCWYLDLRDNSPSLSTFLASYRALVSESFRNQEVALLTSQNKFGERYSARLLKHFSKFQTDRVENAISQQNLTNESSEIDSEFLMAPWALSEERAEGEESSGENDADIAARSSSNAILRACKLVMQQNHILLTGPIYIGITKNLRTRLRQHTDRVYECRDLSRQGFEIEDKDFASRFIRAGLEPRRLLFHQIPLDGESLELDDDDLRHVRQICEKYMNWIVQPRFGKR